MRLLLFFCVILSGCVNKSDPTQTKTKVQTQTAIQQSQSRPDPHSFSNPNAIRVTHIDLDLEVKFKQKILDGHAVLHYQTLKADAKQLVLDTRDLKIKRVEAVNNSKNRKLLWRKGKTANGLGTELIVDLPQDRSPIKIEYQTMPQASGLQWLPPEQTSGKQQPFMFSQSQAIHARSWIPLQDTPSVRVTYNATIKTKPEVRAVLSADNNDQQSTDGVYHFTMDQAIPAYLIAIAVGDLELQPISEHVTVYAEKEVLAAAAYEFAATEDMITATEALYGPYRWGQYDLLILPPSFPFGGMENPKLSHITPTVIAGDRSLDSLIAHELAHSWSGNLVTNALWQDAWLNEGFTSYIESRIIEAIYGIDRKQMEGTLVYQSLQGQMQDMSNEEQKLVNIKPSDDPDDHFSAVTYDKGRFFLEWMEQQVGRKAFDKFLNQYFNHYAFQSIQTSDFLDFTSKNLLAEHADKVTMGQVKTWLFEPGIPEFFNPPTTHRFAQIDEKVKAWEQGKIEPSSINSTQWTTQEWLHFLRALPKQMSDQKMSDLDETFAFTQRQNSEIAHDWLLICINNQYQSAYPRLIEYLSTIGRVKLIKPLYQAMMEHEALHNLAKQIYHKSRPGYHNIATAQIDLIVNNKPEAVN